MEGYSQTNNPNKVWASSTTALCPTVHLCTVVAMLINKKESTINCVKILLFALSGASIESQISLNKTKKFWDRGYGGVEGEVNSFAIVLVGTSRRMKSFPFTFDQHPGPSRRLIQEKDTMASYWALRQSGQNKQFALAHRSGLGWVVLMHTTDESLGPVRYTLITQCRKDAPIRYFSDDDPVVSYVHSGEVTMLTENQRTPEWFVLRKFWIAGTGGAYAVWHLLSRAYQVHDENITAVLRVLTLGGEGAQEEIVDEVVYTRERLNKMIVPDLRVICRNKRLPVSGTKPVLIERIIVGGSGVGGRNNGDIRQQQEVPTDLTHGTLQIKSLSGRDFEQNIHLFALS